MEIPPPWGALLVVLLILSLILTGVSAFLMNLRQSSFWKNCLIAAGVAVLGLIVFMFVLSGRFQPTEEPVDPLSLPTKPIICKDQLIQLEVPLLWKESPQFPQSSLVYVNTDTDLWLMTFSHFKESVEQEFKPFSLDRASQIAALLKEGTLTELPSKTIGEFPALQWKVEGLALPGAAEKKKKEDEKPGQAANDPNAGEEEEKADKEEDQQGQHLTYLVTAIESPKHYHLVFFWTLSDRAEMALPLFQKIAGSFKLVPAPPAEVGEPPVINDSCSIETDSHT